MNMAYKLFWTVSAAGAIALSLSACAAKKKDGVRQNKPAPGTTITRNGNGTTTTTFQSSSGEIATFTAPKAPKVFLADQYGSSSMVTTEYSLAVGGQIAHDDIRTYHFLDESYSDALPAVVGKWNGGFTAKCSDEKCSVYYLVCYLADGSNYFMAAFRYDFANSAEPYVITYKDQMWSAEEVFKDLDATSN